MKRRPWRTTRNITPAIAATVVVLNEDLWRIDSRAKHNAARREVLDDFHNYVTDWYKR